MSEEIKVEGIESEAAVPADAEITAPVVEEPVETMEDYAAELERSMRKISEGDILTGTVMSVTEEEILVDLQYYAEGVIPISEYSEDPGAMAMNELQVGDSIRTSVLRRDDGHGNILLSKKAADMVLAWDALKEMQSANTTVEVKISQAVNAGVVAYLEGIRGFIPASQLALTYVEDPSVYVGKTMAVRVITVDEDKKKLVLSAREVLREAEAEERARKVSNMQVGLVTEGVVESLQPYGAFIRLSNGASGLLHISQIAAKKIKHPGVVLTVGETVKVKVTAIKDGKISLSKKALEEVAAEEITEEVIELPESESLGTSLGDLLKNLKF